MGNVVEIGDIIVTTQGSDYKGLAKGRVVGLAPQKVRFHYLHGKNYAPEVTHRFYKDVVVVMKGQTSDEKESQTSEAS